MYNKILFIVCMLWSTMVVAVNFTATVNTTNISINQSIKLTLLLTDAKAKEQPDLTELYEYFISRGVQKFKNFSSINGKATNEEGWQIILQPKMPGELIIPIISVKTDNGILYTQTITVYVDTQNVQNAQSNLPVTIEGKVSKEEAFVQQPLIYNLHIVYERSIIEPHLDNLEIPDCIVEQIGEQKQQHSIINGKQVVITDIQYLITPLKEGIITIPPITLRGETAVSQTRSRRNIDPFGDIHIFGNFFGMQDYEPFTVQTKLQKIKIKPPIAEINPWLPLYSLDARESWDNLVIAKVGEPIIRSITLTAIGATGKQLPDLKALQEIEGIKAYAEDPKFNHMFDPSINKLRGSREEKFTLIPTKSGSITIPAITITWWDLNQGNKAITVLPEKIINVKAAVNNEAQITTNNQANIVSSNMENANITDKPAAKQIETLYFIITLLIIILLTVILFMWWYMKKMQKKLTVKNTQHLNTSKVILQPLDDLNTIDDINSMHEFIHHYATKYWQLPENVSLKEIPDQLTKLGYKFNQDLAIELFQAIDKALYGRGTSSLEEIKSKWQSFSQEVILIKNKTVKTNDTFGNLNPT